MGRGRQKARNTSAVPLDGQQPPEFARGLPSPDSYLPLAPDTACLATTRVSADGAHVGYMVREAPNGSLPNDSGWRFYAGDETQQYINDPANAHPFSLNAIANHDPAVVPYLDAPKGTAWIRDGNRFMRE